MKVVLTQQRYCTYGYKTSQSFSVIPIIKVTKKEELEMAFGKKTMNCKLGALGEARSVYTQAIALTDKNSTTAVHRGSLAFMVSELIIEELSIASAGTDELEIINVWVVSMTLFLISKPDQLSPFQHDLKNIPNKVTLNMKIASTQ